MCGIAGFIDARTRADESEMGLKAMLARIRHRGPDDEGRYLDPTTGFAFGMRRLSIIDLAGGHQPIWNEDNTVGVVFNGEIYNYLDLRARLSGLGHTFATNSDTEVLVHGYEQYGHDLLPQLRGMFAFAVYDRRTRMVLLARDHFGQKPLYYHAAGGRFAFGSEIKSLLALDWVPHERDPEAFLDYVSWLSIPASRTHLRDIQKLPPGGLLTLDLARPSEPRVQRFWQFAPNAKCDLTEMAPAVAAVDEVFEESVRLHLQSDVPVGVLLSGGLDSRMVAVYARKHLSERLKTFSVGFTDGDSELPEARLTADELGTDHADLVLGPGDLATSISEVAWHLDEPVGDPAAFAVMRVCRLARSKVKVLLGGEGADELFAGYAVRYRGLMTSDDQAARVRSLARLLPIRQSRGYPRSRLGRFWERVAHPRQVAWVAGRAEGFPDDVRAPKGLTNYQLDRFRRRQEELAKEYCPPGRTPLDEMTALDVGWQLAESLLLKADKMSMASSVELRAPFLDVAVAGVAARIKAELKLPRAGGPGKLVLRRCLASKIGEGPDRPKKGFPVPITNWFLGPLRESVQEVIFDKAAAHREVLNRDCLIEAWESFQNGSHGLAWVFYSLWLYEHWVRALEPCPRTTPARVILHP